MLKVKTWSVEKNVLSDSSWLIGEKWRLKCTIGVWKQENKNNISIRNSDKAIYINVIYCGAIHPAKVTLSSSASAWKKREMLQWYLIQNQKKKKEKSSSVQINETKKLIFQIKQNNWWIFIIALR